MCKFVQVCTNGSRAEQGGMGHTFRPPSSVEANHWFQDREILLYAGLRLVQDRGYRDSVPGFWRHFEDRKEEYLRT